MADASLNKWIMVTRDTLPTTLEKWQDLAVRLDQNRRINEFETSLKQGRGRYLYSDNLFQNQETAKNGVAGRIV